LSFAPFAPFASLQTWTNGVEFGAAIPVIDKPIGKTAPANKATLL